MRSSLSLGQLAAVLLSVSPLASAWDVLPPLDSIVVRRQEPSSGQPSQTPAPDPKNGPNLNTGKVEDASPTSGGGNRNATAPKPTARPTFEGHPGGIVMMEPNAMSSSPLYSIGQEITFAWNYTGLLATPTALDILATGEVDKATYTLTQNMTFPTETTGAFRWDTRKFQAELKNKEMMTEQYHLIIYDSERGIKPDGEPGYLAPFDLRMGLYKGKDYKSKDEGWFCSSCSAGVGESDRRAIGMAMFMSSMTVVGFTWFVTGSLL